MELNISVGLYYLLWLILGLFVGFVMSLPNPNTTPAEMSIILIITVIVSIAIGYVFDTNKTVTFKNE